MLPDVIKTMAVFSACYVFTKSSPGLEKLSIA
jgi:hypothetical protein